MAWLYAGRVELLSSEARALLEHEEPRVSPMVVLELEYLFEVGRVSKSATVVMSDLEARLGLVASSVDFQAVVASARLLTWTRDPFDRLIVGQSLAAGARLLTKDETIHANCTAAIW